MSKYTDELRALVDKLDDDDLSALQFSMPWQYAPATGSYERDADGAPITSLASSKEDKLITRQELQIECWNKFNQNPQVNTSVRGLTGRITGRGFEATSEVHEVHQIIKEIELDPRNRLYNFWPKYVARSNVEGELFLCLTLHRDGFIEVDFIDPSSINDKGDDDTGIIFHPNKTTMPLFYNVSTDGNLSDEIDQVPSIFIARYPELLRVARNHDDFKVKDQKRSRTRAKMFKKFGGFNRFIISWDKGFITRRATSYLKTTIQWLNYYEMLKQYEIDHKKSVGSYVWVFSIENPRDFRLWLTLSDEERAKTGIAAKKTPGSSLVLPPGVTVSIESPQLPQIKDEDTDILGMAISGLNEPEDVTMGATGKTFGAVKASRGPMSDRISDEIAYFDRFLKYDFWGSIFFLKYGLGKFREFVKVREATRFDKDGEPFFENVKKRPEEVITISYPISEIADFDARARGLLGVKHGPVSDTLGIPNEQIANALGFGSYGRNRLRKATEEDRYPELIYTMDAEALQETLEGEASSERQGVSSTKKPVAKAKAKPAAKKPAAKPKGK